MWKLVRDLSLALFPQPGANEPMYLFRWRQTVAVGLILIGGSLMGHILWACGWLIVFGINGFALASDVNDLRAQYVEFRTAQLENRINDAKKASCLAYTQGNQQGMDYQNFIIDKTQFEYTKLIKKIYLVPSCDQLVVQLQPASGR